MFNAITAFFWRVCARTRIWFLKKLDPSYLNVCMVKNRNVRIFIDGDEQRNVFELSTLGGWVRHYDDPPRLNNRKTAIVTHTKRGKVTVELDPVADPAGERHRCPEGRPK